MPGFQSTRLATEGALEPFLFLYTDDSIQGNPETCNQSSMMLNYEVKNTIELYFDRLIDKEEAIRRLRFEKPNLQLCFRTQKALESYLHFEGSEQI